MVTAASTIAAVWVTGAEMPEKWFSPSMPFGFMIFFLIYDGLGEEIGWRGFALPQFQESFGSLGGSIVVGVLWALWHLPLFFIPGSYQYGDALIPYIYLLTCWTIVMALFVGKARGSVWPAILLHGSANFVAFTIRYPHTYVHLFWGIAALIAALFLPRPLITLGKKSDSMEHLGA
jgi:membrane protease YdiL (CAAX protease family)